MAIGTRYLYMSHRAFMNKEVFVKHEKAPTEWILTISQMPMFGKSQPLGIIGHFSVTEYQKAHLHTKTIHLIIFPGLYNHPLQRYSVEKFIIEKKRCYLDSLANSAISGGRTWPKLSKCPFTGQYLSFGPIPRSLR